MEFFGLPLLTAPGVVMTPRAATEQLVAEALQRIGDGPARLVDVGTGSGAIAVAVASAAPQAEVWATDTSRAAVALARANVRLHGLSERITVAHGNLLEPVPGRIHAVLANLPYVPAADAHEYPDLAGEPAGAVFARGDGLGPYRRLLAACGERLASDGVIVIQLHRAVLATTAAELPTFRECIERYAPAPSVVPQLAAA